MPDPEAPPEGNPEAATAPPETPEGGGQGQPEQTPEYFSDTFDPASLPDELRGGYKQMRDAFSQKTQTLAEERQQLREAQEVYEALQDPDKQADALRRLGIELEDDDYEDEVEDPYEARIAALEQRYQQSQESAQQQQLEQAEHAFVVDGLQKLQQKTGREFTDEELDTLGHLSTALRDTEGFPDVDAAYERIYATVLPNERKRWEGQKDAPQAPQGSASSEVPDLDTPQGRAAHIAARLAKNADT